MLLNTISFNLNCENTKKFLKILKCKYLKIQLYYNPAYVFPKTHVLLEILI